MRHAALFLTLIVSVLVCGRQAIASRDYPRPLKLEELSTEQQELMRKAMTLAKPLAEERITYHFGKPASCEKLVQSGTYTGDVYAKYSRLSQKGGAVAGHGVYIAGNPHSSITYFAGGGVQVVLAPGTPVIDVTDSDVQRRMGELGLTNGDIYNLPLDAVVRYSEGSDWYVVKGATGVRFEPIDFARMSEADFSRFMEGPLNLRMPSGNEAGANNLWLPGGKLPTGQSEAVVNQIPKGAYTEIDIVPVTTP
jgi:hypothetical protein